MRSYAPDGSPRAAGRVGPAHGVQAEPSHDSTQILLVARCAGAMTSPVERSSPRTLRTSTGEVPLHEYHVQLAGRAWTVLHTGAILSFEEEQHYLSEGREQRPYGAVLWPAAIALAHELEGRGDTLRGRSMLELGAGTGLPGMVAASFGARVVQTDRNDVAMTMCRMNGALNDVANVEYRTADWTSWGDGTRYDYIIGADILYGVNMQEPLRRIFIENLTPGGRLLLSDPFRSASIRLLERMEQDGWAVMMSKWTVAGASEPRPIGVFELAPRA